MTRLVHLNQASRTLRTAGDLASAGLVTPQQAQDLADVTAAYATAITPALAALIDREAANDPIARQFVPSRAELDMQPEELPDPIGDKTHEPVEGIVHRYPDRVLLKAVSVCPVYCRFCFRREMVGPDKDGNLSPAELTAALAYIRAHPEIWEVIITGGDPFMLSARRAAALTRELEAIPHVKVIRWHTRMPVAHPERITDDFVQAIRSSSKPVYVAVHCNHANELSPAARAACARLIDAGIPLLSQTVLLKGVNDTIETLEQLMRAFVELRIKPYYLHHADLAPGTSHFRTTVEQGQDLVRQLRDRVSGLAQPHYVIDIPGGVSKALASPADVETESGTTRLRGRDGLWRDYAGI
ncbi:MAG TPA: lysine-2,3-aminomutase-like protein [Hyphomonadaceae bacterium]|nr:lysine-2,3-aminomutase-like protein [Hyphomonadaceae bacterium]HPN04340.1 lysine-2,3-aminomutase-like protein [Hyphomonadaceae bacterium]